MTATTDKCDIRNIASRLAKGEDIPMCSVPVAARKWLIDAGLAVDDLNFGGYLGSLPVKRGRLANIAAGWEL